MKEFSCSECDYKGQWNGLVHHNRQSICNNDLKAVVIEEFQRVASDIGKVPTREEFDNHSNISKNSAIDKCGNSYNEMVIASGFEPNKSFSITKEDLITELKRLDGEYEEVTQDLMKKEGKYSPDTYRNHFGGWNKSLKIADIGISQVNSIKREDYLKEIQRLKDDLGKVPTGHQMNEHGKYPARSYNDNFGTYNKAIIEAGFEPRYRQYAKGEDSHAYGITGEEHPRYGQPPTCEWIENEKTGNKLRSRWEYEYDNLLYESGLNYDFEKETIYFDKFTYLPDFFIENRFIVEVKGWANERSVQQSQKVVERKEEYIVVGSESSKQMDCDEWFSWEDKKKSIAYMEESIQGV